MVEIIALYGKLTKVATDAHAFFDPHFLNTAPRNMETYKATLHCNITSDVKKKREGGQLDEANAPETETFHKFSRWADVHKRTFHHHCKVTLKS
jgi:hypothetical protein